MKHTVSYQSHQIAAYTEGEGEVIIFLHGWPTNAQLWEAQVDALKQTHRVITLDWLGFGASDKPADHHYTFTDQKEQLNAVIEALVPPDQKLTLIGHDIGGPPTILWASENPQRVARLILLNTILYPFKTPLDAFSEVILSLPLLRDIFVSPLGLRLVMRTNTRRRDTELRQKISAILRPYVQVPAPLKRQTLTSPMHHGRKHEILGISQQFRELAVEKHLIIAKKDPLCYAHIKRLQEENPEVPAHYLDKCGHFMPIDRPEALTAALKMILFS